MNIDDLIKQAEDLKGVPYNSSKVDLWQRRTKSYVETNYGVGLKNILNKALFFSQVITSPNHGQQMHVGALEKAIEFLEELKSEPKKDKSKQKEVRPSSKTMPKLKFGQPGKIGQPGGGGSVFIQAEHFNIVGNGRISADGGDYIVNDNSTRGDNSPVHINYGTINESTAEAIENITKLMVKVGEAKLEEEEKRQLIGNAEIVKASLIQPNPDKNVLQKAWDGMQVAATIGGVAQLLQMIGAVVLPLLK